MFVVRTNYSVFVTQVSEQHLRTRLIDYVNAQLQAGMAYTDIVFCWSRLCTS